jgi:hypothetical protein
MILCAPPVVALFALKESPLGPIDILRRGKMRRGKVRDTT